ncbi:MAG: DegT/DnrJ/EryC1/StrS family aminotransferase [Phycisphaerae bacterium]
MNKRQDGRTPTVTRARTDSSSASPVSAKTLVPYVDLAGQNKPLRGALLSAVERVLDHGRFILGPEVEQLEAAWARRCGTRHAVSVGSGTDALFLVLKALGIGDGDEVITAPNSFVASASAVVHAGARPCFADVGDDFNLNPDAVRRCITDRTRAIIPVHLTGRPAAMDRINDIAASRSIAVIEDAAQAMGAMCGGRPVGGLARAACFSLHPLKTAGACGDAGMITTDDNDLADRLRRLRNHGFARRQEDCNEWGYNTRMDTLQAALALVKLDHLDEWTSRRRAHAALYRERLAGLVRIPDDRPEDCAVYHTFPVEADRRDELTEHLHYRGIGCAVHYRVPIHLLPAARSLGYKPGDLPMAERQADRIVSLPIHEGLTEQQLDRVCDAVRSFYE